MDIGMLRSLVTVVGFICFVGIVFWAYSRAAQKGFDEAAMLPFQEDEGGVSQPSSRSHTQG